MSKKILSFLLALVLLVSLVPAAAMPAFAAESGKANSKGSMNWSYSNGVLTFSGEGDITGLSSDPTKLGWYAHAKDVKTVVFPKGLTTIGSKLFDSSHFPRLSKVVVEDVPAWCKVNFIGSNPLTYAHNLAIGTDGNAPLVDTLTIDSAVAIPAGAFNGTTIKHLVIGYNVTGIGDAAFANCPDLQTVTITNNATIGKNAFMGCPSLHTVSYSGWGNAGSGMFQGCKKLVNASVSNRTNVVDNMFFGCTNLKNVDLTDEIRSIGAGAFNGCSALNEFRLPAKLNTIGEDAFKDCANLGSVAIPSGVTSIGKNAYLGCKAMKGVYITDLQKWCETHFGNANANPLSSAHNLFLNNNVVNTLTLPDDLASISEYAFAGATSIHTLNMNARIRKPAQVGGHTFDGSGIKHVNFTDIPQREALRNAKTGHPFFAGIGSYSPKDPVPPTEAVPHSCGPHLTWRVTEKGDELIIEGDGKIITDMGTSWNDADGWLNAKDPKNPTAEEKNAAKALMDATLPKVTRITFAAQNIEVIEDTAAFNDLFAKAKVDTIRVFNLGGYAQIDFNGLALLDKRDLMDVDKILDMHLVLPDNIEKVSANAFKGANFNTVTIPGVYKIEANAFDGCKNLEHVYLSEGTQKIEANAFANCHVLDDITLPSTMRYLGDGAFSYSGRVDPINLNDGLEVIGAHCFAGDTNLSQLIIPDSVHTIGEGALDGCVRLTHVQLPEDLHTIPAEMFKDCSGIKRIQLPERVYSYGADAFEGCSGLQFVDITHLANWCVANFANDKANPLYYAKSLHLNGSEVADLSIPDVPHISAYAFNHCHTLTNVYIPDTVKVIGDYAFSDCPNIKEVFVKPSTWEYINSTSTINKSNNEGLFNAHLSFTGPVEEPGIGTDTYPVTDDLVAMLTKVLPFEYAAKQVGGKWIIGYGTPSAEGQRVTREEAAAALRSYLERAAGKVVSTSKFGSLDTGAQLDALASFTYFNGSSWLSAGQPLYDELSKKPAKRNLIAAFCAQSVAKSQAQMDLRLMEAHLYMTGKYVTSVPSNYKWVNLDPNGGLPGKGGTLVGYDTNTSAYIPGAFDAIWKNNEMEFSGWFTKEEGGTKVITLDGTTSFKTLYAHWQPKGSGVEGGTIVGNPVDYRLPAHFAIAASRENASESGRIRVFKQPISIPEGSEEFLLLKEETHISVLQPNDVMHVVAEYRYPDTGRHLWVKLEKSGWVDLGDVPGYSVEYGTVKLDPQKRLPVYPSDTVNPFVPDLNAFSTQGLRDGIKVSVISKKVIDNKTWGYTIYWDPDATPMGAPIEKVKGEYKLGWIDLAFVEMDGAINPEDEEPEDDGMILRAKGKIVGADRVNCRKNPRTDSTIFVKLPYGTEVNVYDYTTTNGKKWSLTDDGWVCSMYIEENQTFTEDDPVNKPQDETPKEDTSGNVGSRDNQKVLASGYAFNNVSLTVRKGPGNTFPRVDKIEKGGRVHVYQTQMFNGVQWGRVDPIEDKWACMAYITLDNNAEIKNPEKPADQQKPASSQAIVHNCSTGVNLRASATPHSAFQGVLPVGKVVTIVDEVEKDGTPWYKVKTENKEAWACGLYLKKMDMPVNPGVPGGSVPGGVPGINPGQPASGQRGIVIGDRAVNVRVLPGVAGHAVVKTLKPGASVTVFNEQTVGEDLWYQIEDGWMAAQYIQLGNANVGGGIGTTQTTGNQYLTGTVLQPGGLPVLAGPGQGYKAVATAPYASTLTVFELKMIDNIAYGRTTNGWVDMRQMSMNGSGITGTGTMATVANCKHSVRVRNAPNGTEISNARLGSRVEVLEVVNGVARTPLGWIHMNYLVPDGPINPQQPVNPVNPVNPTNPAEPTKPEDGKKPEPSNEGIPFTMDGVINKPSNGGVIPLRMIPGEMGDWDAEVDFGDKDQVKVQVTKLVDKDGSMWCRIEGGWVKMESIILNQHVVTEKAQLVYREPNTNQVAPTPLNKGKTVKILKLHLDGNQKVWGYIEFTNFGDLGMVHHGWIELTDVSKADSYNKTFVAMGLAGAEVDLRAEPAEDAEIVGDKLGAMSSVQITELRKDGNGAVWALVNSTGWMPVNLILVKYEANVISKTTVGWADMNQSEAVMVYNQGDALAIGEIVLNDANEAMGKLWGEDIWVSLSQISAS